LDDMHACILFGKLCGILLDGEIVKSLKRVGSLWYDDFSILMFAACTFDKKQLWALLHYRASGRNP
jgi:hypothetical protein